MASIIINGLTQEDVDTLALAAEVAGTPKDGEGNPVWAEYLGVRKLLADARRVAFSVNQAEPVEQAETETHEEVTP